ncbi:tetratricopeptide repeat protein [Antarctobacter heliothermus]|uniref:Tetratricopeptide repeat protein n=1 Tax=Antarctobacter heliothermus TaxID=74033 RepID=A0A222E6S7_9RHOB|nr:tetratricopeptide repeat protein [Antarctobacter heliothermus]ASP21913.1 tetratricopeptide repeat protein [Antarctobacter heliothermus]
MASFGELLGAEILEAREAQRLTQLALAQEVFDDENYVRRIGDYETGKVARPQAKVYRPICDFLGITSKTIGALKAQATDAKSVTDDELLTLRTEKGSLEQALSDLQTLTRAQLETLASRFELDKPYEASDGALIEFLTNTAQDYRALRAEVDAIDEGVKALSNLKTSAMAAFDSGDLDEVETLLSRVQEIAKDEAAKAAEIRADAALLRQRVDFARALLLDAADSFAIVDPLEPARRRLKYGAKFYYQGLRYGGDGLRIAVEFWEKCAHIAGREGSEILRGKALSNLGSALRNQGTRTDGPKGAALLEQAVSAYRSALEVRTREKHPEQWAMTQNNLASALRNQSSRAEGPESMALLEQAVSAYRAALEVRTIEKHPVQWAMTQNNFGVTLEVQATRMEDATRLAQAVMAFRAALEVYTRDVHPVDWAGAQSNLANSLATQGIRTDGPEGAALLAQAVTAYRATLEVRVRDVHPVYWAETQYNLASTEDAQAEHDTCTDPLPHLRAALDHVTAALEVYDPEHMPYDFGTATKLKTRLKEKLAALNTP